MLNLSILLEDSARRYPSREAVVLGDTRLTYAQVNGAANQVANLLVERGIKPGDKVALSCPNLPYFPIVYYGILKAGAVVVPLNVLLKGREVAYHLADSEAVAYFCFQGTAELPIGECGVRRVRGHGRLRAVLHDHRGPDRRVADRGRRDAGRGPRRECRRRSTAWSPRPPTPRSSSTPSGTTGQAKGAELSHSNIVMNALTCNRLFGSEPASDTHLLTLPLFHSFGSDGADERRLLDGGDPDAAAAVRRPAGGRRACRARTSPSSPASRRCGGDCSAR